MGKQTKAHAAPAGVRTRRAYFDCRYGQLHVRTAFPTTGGFDEGVTLFCLHPQDASSRIFDQFLPEIGEDRSVYAPDMPGFGESDPAPVDSPGDAALAVADLAADLRLRHIDVLGLHFGAGVALELAVARPELVRRLVLMAPPSREQSPAIKQQSLVLRRKGAGGDDASWVRGGLSQARFLEVSDQTGELFRTAPQTLARQIAAFLAAKS
jgi:pimeloyl-ACP methyl ester carboxylesterase